MKIEVINKYVNKEFKGYEVIRYTPCCDILKEADTDTIRLDYTWSSLINIPEGMIRDDTGRLLAMYIVTPDTQYPDCDVYYPIAYCPYCGEKIEIKVVGEKDYTDECKKLDKDLKNMESNRRQITKKTLDNWIKEHNRILNMKGHYIRALSFAYDLK